MRKCSQELPTTFEDSSEEELSKEEEEKLAEVSILGNSKNKTLQRKNILQTCFLKVRLIIIGTLILTLNYYRNNPSPTDSFFKEFLLECTIFFSLLKCNVLSISYIYNMLWLNTFHSFLSNPSRIYPHNFPYLNVLFLML